jgi:hypothetical protein
MDCAVSASTITTSMITHSIPDGFDAAGKEKYQDEKYPLAALEDTVYPNVW